MFPTHGSVHYSCQKQNKVDSLDYPWACSIKTALLGIQAGQRAAIKEQQKARGDKIKSDFVE